MIVDQKKRSAEVKARRRHHAASKTRDFGISRRQLVDQLQVRPGVYTGSYALGSRRDGDRTTQSPYRTVARARAEHPVRRESHGAVELKCIRSIVATRAYTRRLTF